MTGTNPSVVSDNANRHGTKSGNTDVRGEPSKGGSGDANWGNPKQEGKEFEHLKDISEKDLPAPTTVESHVKSVSAEEFAKLKNSK